MNSGRKIATTVGTKLKIHKEMNLIWLQKRSLRRRKKHLIVQQVQVLVEVLPHQDLDLEARLVVVVVQGQVVAPDLEAEVVVVLVVVVEAALEVDQGVVADQGQEVGREVVVVALPDQVLHPVPVVVVVPVQRQRRGSLVLIKASLVRRRRKQRSKNY